jgi:hypothetical protein
LEQIENLKQTQNLERIENLEQINLKITNLDYRDVIITTPIEETIVYCDIPYRNTETYNKQTFDYEAFYDFFRNNKYTCFLSEYNAPFNCIFEIPKMKLLNNTNLDKRGYVIEKLYFNRLV